VEEKDVGSDISNKEKSMRCRMKGYGAISSKHCGMNRITR